MCCECANVWCVKNEYDMIKFNADGVDFFGV